MAAHCVLFSISTTNKPSRRNLATAGTRPEGHRTPREAVTKDDRKDFKGRRQDRCSPRLLEKADKPAAAILL
jgi:hypothetical protein